MRSLRNIHILLAAQRRDYKESADLGEMSLEEGQAKIKHREQEFLALNPIQRIARVLNNFRFWLPGSWYRELHESEKAHGEMNQDVAVKKEQLMEDIDQLVRQKGYESIVESIIKQNKAESHEQWNALVDLYVSLREKEYDRDFLRS